MDEKLLKLKRRCIDYIHKYATDTQLKQIAKLLGITSDVATKHTCGKCGYVWEPRVDNPKSCPACKARIN